MGTGSGKGWRRVRRGLSRFFCGNIFLEIFLRLIALQSGRGQCVRTAGGPRFVVEGVVRTGVSGRECFPVARMNALPPTERFLRLLHAAPEVLAAVDGLLSSVPGSFRTGSFQTGTGSAKPVVAEDWAAEVLQELRQQRALLTGLHEQVAALAGRPAPAASWNEAEATRVFGMLQKLRSRRAGLKAPLYDVFLVTVLEGLSQRAAAKKCGCSLGLLSTRVGEMEKEFGLGLKQLQALATPILEMQTTVKADCWRTATSGDTQPSEGEDPGGWPLEEEG